jgi:methionyl aminopeptidase
MIEYKTDAELEIMAEGGKILREVFEKTLRSVEVGMTTEHIDIMADKLIHEAGAEPAFKRVKGYSWTTCICINEQVVHTPPSKRTLKNGDIVTIDMGVFYKGFNTDKADTIIVGNTTPELELFLKKGRQTLTSALQKARVGNRISAPPPAK